MAIEQLRLPNQVSSINFRDYVNSRQRLVWAKRLHFGCERYNNDIFNKVDNLSDTDLNKINTSLNHLIHTGSELALFSDVNGQLSELLVDNNSLYYNDPLHKLPAIKIDDPSVFVQFERTPFSIDPKFIIYRWNNKQKEKLFSSDFSSIPSSHKQTVVLGKETQTKIWKTLLLFNNHQQPRFSIRPDLVTRTL